MKQLQQDGVDSALNEAPNTGRASVIALSTIVTLVLIGINLGRIQAAFWPVLGEQSIPAEKVLRTAGTEVHLTTGPNAGQSRWRGATMCWERFSVKNYEAPIDNYDVFLDVASRNTGKFDTTNRSFPEVYDEMTGDPVSTDRAPKAGVLRRRLCVALRSTIAPDQPIRLQQAAHFQGPWGIYSLPPTPLPEIVSLAANAPSIAP